MRIKMKLDTVDTQTQWVACCVCITFSSEYTLICQRCENWRKAFGCKKKNEGMTLLFRASNIVFDRHIL